MYLGAGRPALFLDRDGIINIDYGFVSEKENFKFQDDIFDLCQFFKSLDFRIIIITNQSGIGRGLFTVDKFHTLTNWMLEAFEERGIRVDLVLASALDPNNSSASEFEKNFRKPGPGMLIAAQEIFQLDLEHSLLIGDRETDIQAGKIAGVGHLYAVSTVPTHGTEDACFPNLGECLLRLREIFQNFNESR